MKLSACFKPFGDLHKEIKLLSGGCFFQYKLILMQVNLVLNFYDEPTGKSFRLANFNGQEVDQLVKLRNMEKTKKTTNGSISTFLHE